MLSAFDEPLEEFNFTFSTPRVEIVRQFPESNRLAPVSSPMAIIFNQTIDPEQVLSLISLSLGQDGFLSKLTKKSFSAVELLSPEEVEQDTELQLFLTSHKAKEGCWLAFRSKKNLLYDSTVTVKLEGSVRINSSNSTLG